jgi:NADH:ubiquinone oxidoreductase subunit C
MSEMGTTITIEQNAEAAKAAVDNIAARFGDAGVTVEAIAHKAGKKFEYVRITCSPEQWRAVAKHMKKEIGVNNCAMVTGTHYPSGGDRGWEVAYHLHRWPIRNVEAHKMIVHKGEDLKGDDIPMEFEVFINLPEGNTPSVPSIQDIWEGADWNEKETWDLVGIDFEGHINMHRVLNPHDSPVGFHPLQRQHKIRYHDFNEMYDDPQGFGRKPVDEGRVK